MATSWNIPALVNKIASDIPGLNTLLKALLKWDTSGTEDIPTGAKRMTDVTGGKQLQQYDGAAWGSTGKLMHDVDMLDGYHASASQTANTIPVRDANGSLPGNITGNAATATEASSLANDYVVPVANGGTGANTEAGARQALGTNNGSNITTGVVGTGVGGTGRTDGMVTDVMLTDYSVSATSVGALGDAPVKNAVDADTLTVPGTYFCTDCTVALKWPQARTHFVRVTRNGVYIYQEAFQYNSFVKYRRWSTNTGGSWTRWYCDYLGAGNMTIYLSKDGADTNTGLTANSPLLTVAAALQQAAQIGSTGTITFRFGPGDWGDVTISANGLTCAYISIYPTTGGTSKTDPGNMPTFGTLTLINGQFQVGNIEANYIYARSSYAYVRYYNKINRMLAEDAYVILAGATALDIKYDSAGTNGIFNTNLGGIIYINEPVALASGLANSAAVRQGIGEGCVCIGDNFSSSGTFTGKKFIVESNGSLSFNYSPTKKTTDSLPGTGSTINGGLIINGVPAKATALETARNIRVNLASTTAASFDGTANASPGVTGVLPIANGGTGSSTQNFVDLSNAQTVAGIKTLTGSPVIKNSGPVITLQQTDVDKGTNPTGNQTSTINFVDKDGTATANRTGAIINTIAKTSGLASTIMYAYQFADASTGNAALGVYCSADGATKYAVAPTPAASANDTKIATTAWVNTKMSSNAPATMYNTRTVLTTSGTWTASVTGWHKVTCIGGGGSGGSGGYVNNAGKGGLQGGSTSFGSILTAIGGSGGGGGGSYDNEVGGGGGGGAGEIAIGYFYFNKNASYTLTVGAGAGSPGQGAGTGTKGNAGSGPSAGGQSSQYSGGIGAAGASNGCSDTKSGFNGGGGSGGRNGTGYGGGGGGGAGLRNDISTGICVSSGGAATDGASYGSRNAGGAGGAGAVIIEYFDPSKAA